MRARKNAQHLEMFSGLLVAATVLLLAVTVHAELTGRPALVPALVLALLVLADVVVLKAARQQRRHAEGAPRS